MRNSVKLTDKMYLLSCLSLCLIPECVEMVQRFREVPESALVTEGTNVFLRCTVDEQKGLAQWTKDGFALGFQRSVPGYPRYSYEGNETLGEHHLVISNVALEDDGEYQCQVGPTNEEIPIWAASKVTVLVAPSAIRINSYEDGAVMEVSANSPITIACLIQNSRPVATATWYKDGVQIDYGAVRNVIELGNRPKLVSLRSTLILSVGLDDQRIQYSCRGHHPALNSAPTALVSTIVISVLHPPTPPVITGYSGQTLIAGDNLTLSCRSQGGNPPPHVAWYRQDVILDDAFTNDDTGVVNEFSISVSSNEDNVMMECRVTHPVANYSLSASVALSVLYPPAAVIIEAPAVISVQEFMKLKCQTLPANPKAQVRWIIENKRVSSNKTKVVRFPQGGWVTTSELMDYPVRDTTSRDGARITVVCEAVSPITDKVVSQEVIVDIVVPPEAPLLNGLPNELHAMSKVPISCYSRGGNPSPTIQLFKGRELLPAKTRERQNVTEAFSEMLVLQTDNKKFVSCKVTHPAFRTPNQVSHLLNVIFGPANVSLTAIPPEASMGDELALVCETSWSNPSSHVAWNFDGDSRKPPKAENQIISDENATGEKTRSEIFMIANASDDGRIVTCEASNGIDFPVKTTATLHVLHPPVWIKVPEGMYRSLEGENSTISVSASANPGPVRYTWKFGNETLKTSSDLLRFQPLNRTHTGVYFVGATSTRGSINASFTLEVQYAAELIDIKDEIKILSGSTELITFRAGGNPPPNVTLTSFYSESVLAFGTNWTTLRISEASSADTQEVLSLASNRIGQPAIQRTRIIVQHATALLRNSGMSWVPYGDGFLALCHARGDPDPTFQWVSNSRDLNGDQDTPFFFSPGPILADGLSLWVSIINISDYRPKEEVGCSASNSLGSDAEKMRISKDDVAAPNGFQILRLNNKTIFTVEDLSPGGIYMVTIYTGPERRSIDHVGKTLLLTLADHDSSSKEHETKYLISVIGGIKMPKLALLITIATGSALLLLNLAAITCYLRSRKGKPKSGCGPGIIWNEQNSLRFATSNNRHFLEVTDFPKEDEEFSELKEDSAGIFPLEEPEEESNIPRSYRSLIPDYHLQLNSPSRSYIDDSIASFSHPSGATSPCSFESCTRGSAEKDDLMQLPDIAAAVDELSEMSAPIRSRRLQSNCHWVTPTEEAQQRYVSPSLTTDLTSGLLGIKSNFQQYFSTLSQYPSESERSSYYKGRTSFPQSETPSERRSTYSDEQNERQMFSTLNPASLYDINPKSETEIQTPEFCKECQYGYMYPKRVERYGPSYGRGNFQYYSSLPRQFNATRMRWYDSCQYCEECSQEYARLKSAASSYELHNDQFSLPTRSSYISNGNFSGNELIFDLRPYENDAKDRKFNHLPIAQHDLSEQLVIDTSKDNPILPYNGPYPRNIFPSNQSSTNYSYSNLIQQESADDNLNHLYGSQPKHSGPKVTFSIPSSTDIWNFPEDETVEILELRKKDHESSTTSSDDTSSMKKLPQSPVSSKLRRNGH